MGTTDIDTRLEELMIDGMLFAFQEQQSEDTKVMPDEFGLGRLACAILA